MGKLRRLKKILKDMGSVLVAYSAGTDSTFLLKVAKDVLGDRVLAVTAVSPTYPKAELEFARLMADRLGVRHKIIKTEELKDKNFALNPNNRCYFCKKELFSKLRSIAKLNDLDFVIEASNISDKQDFRPGDKAKQEQGVRSPLVEAGFTKNDIRKESKGMNLCTWDKPSQACLASRFPYGTNISAGLLKRIENAEKYLSDLGFRQVRVRHYDSTCRIEVAVKDIGLFMKKRASVIMKLKNMGYKYITLDLEGYRTGSMNEVIEK